jgi:DNA-binding response OmpR family regulator
MLQNILVVEDDKFLRELIVQKLNREGYQTIEAIDGEEGVKKIKDEKPALVLLDLILPGIDGFEVLEQVKKDPEAAKVPVIILSNLGQKDDVEKGFKLGAADYLIKAHFTPAEIISKVKAILNK